MAVQLSIDYDQLVELVEQLSEEQQQALIAQLLADKTSQHPLTADEKFSCSIVQKFAMLLTNLHLFIAAIGTMMTVVKAFARYPLQH